MEKTSIIDLLGSVSMAVVNCLVSKDNGIGSDSNNLSLSAINSLYGLRKAIIGENIDLVLKDKEFSLNTSSFLNTISYDDISNKTYGDIPESIANIVEMEILQVRDIIIPEINTLTDEFNSISSKYITPPTATSLFKVEFFKYYNILRLLNSTELVEHYDDAAIDMSDIIYSYPRMEDFSAIKAGIKVNNVVVDSSIDEMLSGKPVEYWLALYNDIFTNISPNNERLGKLAIDKVRYSTELVFCFLVARALSSNTLDVGIISGDGVEYKKVITTIYKHFRQVLARAVNFINNTSESLFDYDNDRDTLIVRKDSMGDLDIDTIIGAAILGIYKTEDVLANVDSCREQCMKAIDLTSIDRRNQYNSEIRNIYMNIALKYLSIVDNIDENNNPIDIVLKGKPKPYVEARKDISELIYGMDASKLLDPYKLFKSLALYYKYYDTNASYIMDRMSFYLASLDKSDSVYKDVAEYVALEMITKYLVNAHIVIETED